MKSKRLALGIIVVILEIIVMVAIIKLVTKNEKKDEKETPEVSVSQNFESEKEGEKNGQMELGINGKIYVLNIENKERLNELVTILPPEFEMKELNGNEKYFYFDGQVSTDEYNPKTIQKGDVMLYGDNCLVIFYDSFDTEYRYTKIGHIDNLEDLGQDSVIVSFIVK